MLRNLKENGGQAWRPDEPVVGVGAIGREVLDAGHDGHGSEFGP